MKFVCFLLFYLCTSIGFSQEKFIEVEGSSKQEYLADEMVITISLFFPTKVTNKMNTDSLQRVLTAYYSEKEKNVLELFNQYNIVIKETTYPEVEQNSFGYKSKSIRFVISNVENLLKFSLSLDRKYVTQFYVNSKILFEPDSYNANLYVSAIQNATEKAENLAKISNVTLGKITQITEKIQNNFYLKSYELNNYDIFNMYNRNNTYFNFNDINKVVLNTKLLVRFLIK